MFIFKQIYLFFFSFFFAGLQTYKSETKRVTVFRRMQINLNFMIPIESHNTGVKKDLTLRQQKAIFDKHTQQCCLFPL